MPPGGDPISQRIALRTHTLVCELRKRRLTSTYACEQFGFNREVWSDVLNGHRWPGETVAFAILDTITKTS